MPPRHKQTELAEIISARVQERDLQEPADGTIEAVKDKQQNKPLAEKINLVRLREKLLAVREVFHRLGTHSQLKTSEVDGLQTTS